MHKDELERLQSLSLKIADAESIDWETVTNETAAIRPLLGRLRNLEAIARAHAAGPQPEPAGQRPTRWGPLEIREELGAGGQGTVYRAFDPRLRREVALKLYNAGDADWEPDQLLKEARALARVRHPNVVLVYGADDHDSRTGVWMELVKGRNLTDQVRFDGPVSPQETARIGRDLCRGISAVHAAGMVHRDVKPSNVMLDADDRVVLMDFGLAVTPTEGWMERGFLRGTPVSMSPEQMDGREATQKTDAYSIGVVLFFLLTGRYPFRAAEFETLRNLTLSGERPSVDDLCPEVPKAMSALIDSALSRRPEDRPSTVSSMAETLARFLDAPAPVTRQEGNLPRTGTRFIGREGDFAAVRRALEANALVTLVGAGGIGKTRLAIEAGRQLTDGYPGGIWFIDLAVVGDDDHVLQALTKTLGFRDLGDVTPMRLLARRFGDHKGLLVVDNCEHVLTGASRLIAGVLEHCATVDVLATSRERLSVPGEQVHHLAPLGLPGTTGDPNVLLASEAVRLFADRAHATRDDFALDATTAPHVASICTRLDGHPLAIELAAAWVDTLGVAELERMVASDEFDRLQRGAAGRQGSLEATVDWSYQRIGARDQVVFRALSTLAGAFDLEAAILVADLPGVGVESLGQLLARSLLLREPGEGPSRYRMLEPLRRFGRRRREDASETEACRTRHRDHFLSVAETANEGLGGRDAAACLERLESVHPDLLQALTDGSNNVASRLQLGAALWRFWFLRGHLGLGRSMLEQILKQYVADPDKPDVNAGNAMNGLGGLCWAQGDHETALKWIRAGLAVKKALDDSSGVARGISNLGSVRFDQGDYATAWRRFSEALQMFREQEDQVGIAGTLSNLGLVRYARREWEDANELFLESLGIRREMEDQLGIIICCVKLGRIAYHQGEFEASQTLLDEAIKVSRELGDIGRFAFALQGVAGLLAARGDAIFEDAAEEADDLFREAARLCGAHSKIADDLGSSPPYDERLEQEELTAHVEKRIGPIRLRDAWKQGRSEGRDARVPRAV